MPGSLPEIHINAKEQAVFKSTDRIFLGEGLFETIKVIEAEPLFAKEHWLRLTHSLTCLNIDVHLPYEVWLERLQQCIQEGGIHTGGIKAIIGGGTAERGLTEPGCHHQLMLQCFNYKPRETPLALCVAPWRRDAANPIYQHKTVNYLEAILASRYAKAQGCDDVLFLNTQSQIAETSVANVFLIQDSTLITPKLDEGVLPGILRQKLIAMALEMNFNVIERSISYDHLIEAEAMFACNVLQGIVPVYRVDQIQFKTSHSVIAALSEHLGF